MVTLSRLGRKRRLVLMLEWLTLCPTCAVLPLSSHRHDIGEDLSFVGRRPTRSREIDLVSTASRSFSPWPAGPFGRPRTYSDEAPLRQAGLPRGTERHREATPRPIWDLPGPAGTAGNRR